MLRTIQCGCDSSGKMAIMKAEIVQKWIAGVQHEVVRFICPMCGKREISVNTHGVAITQSEMDALIAKLD